MDYKEIIEALKQHYDAISEEDRAHDESWDNFIEDLEFEMTTPATGPWEIVYEHGGSDEGSQWERVMHFKDHGIFIQLSGYYSSYEGVDFDGDQWGDVMTEVFPYEKTITLYSPKKQTV